VPAASLTGKLWLKIRQAHVIRPSIGADCDGMAAAIVGAIDQETAHAGCAHFSEGDFLGPLEHAPMITPIAGKVKPLGVGVIAVNATSYRDDSANVR
jgi:hypothetical protein